MQTLQPVNQRILDGRAPPPRLYDPGCLHSCFQSRTFRKTIRIKIVAVIIVIILI
jgi:hypothetical protein